MMVDFKSAPRHKAPSKVGVLGDFSTLRLGIPPNYDPQHWGKVGAPTRPTAYELLGGDTIFAHEPTTAVETHDMLNLGIPVVALDHLMRHVRLLQNDSLFKVALGMSPRTRQRHAAQKRALLNREQSDRTWQFTEVLAMATDVLGDQAKAEEWLATPAMALDQRAPLELLGTTSGLEMVKEHLIRMDYGVFA